MVHIYLPSFCGDRERGCAEGELSPDWLCSQLSLHLSLHLRHGDD